MKITPLLLSLSLATTLFISGCEDSTSPTVDNNNKATGNTATKVELSTKTRAASYLIDTHDMTLYNFDADTLDVSNCLGACLDIWPIFSASISDNVDFGLINSEHATYRKHALYYFFKDENASNTLGDNVNKVWHLVYPPADFTPINEAKLSPEKRVQTYLTNTEGFALYTFDKDTALVSNCEGDCLAIWPAYSKEIDLSKLPTGTVSGDFKYFERSDGSQQLAYKNKPLYKFVKDTQSGQSNGDWVKGVWHLVDLGSTQR